ncbi:MAG: malto-oligosyltrehalose synthase [Thermoplasmata archaeon]
MIVRPTVATYRLQISSDFDLYAAARVVPYLANLGVDTLYLSPLLAARSGSAHGYDVINPTKADASRGGEKGLRALANVAHRRGMHLLLDIVPNHQAATPENPWWRDVLERGPASKFASTFDINWDREVGGRPQVVLPVLSDTVDESIRLGRVQLRVGPGELLLDVEGTAFPIGARATSRFLHAVRSHLRLEAGRPKRSSPRSWTHAKLRRLTFRKGRRPSNLAKAFARVLEEFQAPGPTGSLSEFARKMMDDLAYRPVPYWEDDAINYRRFFDVNHLVGVRVEDPQVFQRTHERIVEWVRRGYIDGLRVDHIDGLADPDQYLRRLQRALAKARQGTSPSVQLWVEKILARTEALAPEWPVQGTTGYDAMARLTGVLTNPDGAPSLAGAYEWVVRAPESFEREADAAKREVQRTSFRSETKRLASGIAAATSRNARFGKAIEAALISFTAGLPIYRTYGRNGTPPPEELEALAVAWRRAARRATPGGRRALGLVRDGLALDFATRSTLSKRRSAEGNRRRWQQWTPAVAAKGIEDTALFRFVRSVGLNEVGSDPAHFGTSLTEFHHFMIDRQALASGSLNATSTHDTKWGEDARARLMGLTDRAEEWARRLPMWFRWIEQRPRLQRSEPPIRRAEIYLLLQALVASRPINAREVIDYPERFRAYALKASREAKVGTSWRHPDLAYEQALDRFAAWLATAPTPPRFRRELEDWTRSLAYLGMWNSVAMTVLKMNVPGVPDLYQGSERSALHLVDPDNRRPVDFRALDRSLHRLMKRPGSMSLAGVRRLCQSWWTGDLKQYVTHRALQARSSHLDLLSNGRYVPLQASGREPQAVLAFARAWRDEWLLVAIGRHLARRGVSEDHPPDGTPWNGVEIALPPGAPRTWNDELIARRPIEMIGARSRLHVAEIFETLPVAILFGVTSKGTVGQAPRKRR